MAENSDSKNNDSKMNTRKGRIDRSMWCEYNPDKFSSKSLKRDNADLDIEHLIPYKNHPFKLYEGKRFEDLVKSIKESGVLEPIIVRPSDNDQYEILAGHNRVNAAREAGLKTISAIIYENLSKEDAELIVTETNFIQRSIKDMKHSELAAAITMLYNALKMKPGYRSDLVESLQVIEGDKPANIQIGNKSDDTDSQLGNRSNTMTKVGEQYGFSKNTIHRYLQINKLSDALKARLDNGGIARGAAVDLSFLRDQEQEIVDKLLGDNGTVSLEQAKKLKEQSKKVELNETDIKQLLEVKSSPGKKKSIKFSGELFSKYFREDQNDEDIEATVAKALEQYFQNV